jgi:hypothetical protein
LARPETSPHQSFADGAVPDFKSSNSQASKGHSRVSSHHIKAAVSEHAQSEKSFDKNKFALKLKKDSMASNFDAKAPKYVAVSKYSYRG